MPQTAAFCPVCGAKQTPSTYFCVSCGKPMETDARFCASCGASAQQPTPDRQPSQPMQQQPSVPLQAVGTTAASAASTAATAAATVAATAGKAVAGGVKKAHRTARRVAVFALVIVFLLGAASACLSVFVSGPDDKAVALFEAVDNMDFDGMMACLDPQMEAQLRAGMGLTGSIFGAMTGFDLDFEALASLSPLFGAEMKEQLGMEDINVESATVVLYSDASPEKIVELCAAVYEGRDIGTGYDADNAIMNFLYRYHLSIPGLEKLVANTAVVAVEVNGETIYLPMKNIGKGDWRLAIDLTMLASMSE